MSSQLGSAYDVIVIGSGLAGLTGANYLGKQGYKVLLIEQHHKLGGLATWFQRKGGHWFDVSLHGFPSGMLKSCRKYWNKAIADSIIQLKDIRFSNPEFQISTTFDRSDFTRILQEHFKISAEIIEEFFNYLRSLNFYDNPSETTQEVFQHFFPDRPEVHRLLMEPITYANGSSLQDPALTYGIVFSNFMDSGVFTFQGGTDQLIEQMKFELQKNEVTIATRTLAEKILVEKTTHGPRVRGLICNGQELACKAILSNANLKQTLLKLLASEFLPNEFYKKAQDIRINTSSCQVYMGIRKGETLPVVGDLLFTSEAPQFSTEEMLSPQTKSKTFSIYYPKTRPHLSEQRYTVVASLNARFEDWDKLNTSQYQAEKQRLCQENLAALEAFIPGVSSKIDWIEAATPKTFQRYTLHEKGASFGTKFEGLEVSTKLPEIISGLFHAGSVGIIMSGWLGTMNYGVITANKIDNFLCQNKI